MRKDLSMRYMRDWERNLVQRYLPIQMDLDIILKIIQRKVSNGTHLPVAVKEIQVGYIGSSYFKDAFL